MRKKRMTRHFFCTGNRTICTCDTSIYLRDIPYYRYLTISIIFPIGPNRYIDAKRCTSIDVYLTVKKYEQIKKNSYFPLFSNKYRINFAILSSRILGNKYLLFLKLKLD